ncbi:MAG: ATP-dependent RNA helicase DbpA [Deltaproteobacteria bacterium]|nr:ATP-dependent RNA helicase DbpA [Deltaproteobacteria bacterium]
MSNPPPFTSLPLSPSIQQVVRDVGYETMTPIQALVISPLLEGLDIIGQSRTGSGKTAAFAIPLLQKIEISSRKIQVLVLSPTRELCQQVAREFRSLGRFHKNLQVLTLSGGHPVYLDLRALEHGAQIIVGTPGRLLDHIERKTLDLGGVKTVILDEADRMLDMGFRDAIELILKKTPAQRQTALFSATFPSTIESLSQRYQRKPIRLTVEPSGVESPIEQQFYSVNEHEKPAALLAFLRSRQLESTLVFCNLKISVDELCQNLRQSGHSVDKLHGGLEQIEREKVMAKFRNSSTHVLIATDVAARGLDIAGLDAVVNFDMPREPESYIHRIGRTGRAGATGLSVTFVLPTEHPRLERLWGHIGEDFELKKASSLTANPVAKRPAEASMDTLSISAGRKDKLRPGDILGALTGDAGIKGEAVGKIEILDRMSFVALHRSVSATALSRLQSGKIKGRRFIVQMVH